MKQNTQFGDSFVELMNNRQEALLEVVRHQVSSSIDSYISSTMNQSMQLSVINDMTQGLAHKIVNWVNVSYKHEPIVFERTVTVKTPETWIDALKIRLGWNWLIPSTRYIDHVRKFKFEFDPRSIFIDHPYLPEFRECKFIKRVFATPPKITEMIV